MWKTAEYVHKNGTDFEKLILARESKEDFAFLQKENSKNSIYSEYLEILRERKAAESKGKDGPPSNSENEEVEVASPDTSKRKASRLGKVRDFLKGKQEEKLGSIAIVQQSAIQKLDEERQKRRKTISNLHKLFG